MLIFINFPSAFPLEILTVSPPKSEYNRKDCEHVARVTLQSYPKDERPTPTY